MKELDIVELKDGQKATILEVYDGGAAFLVEIVDDDGKTVGMPTVKAEEIVRVVWKS